MEDEVVEEIPMYLSGENPDIQGDFYLLQYPLRVRGRPYGNEDGMGKISEALWKPNLNCLEIAFPLHASDDAPNFDADCSFKMEKLRLRSRGNPAATQPANFVVGTLVESLEGVTGKIQKRFVLRPLNGVLQMYPRFDHVDDLVRKEAALDMDIEEEEALKKKANEAKVVMAKAKKIRSNENQSFGPVSWMKVQKDFQKEAWIPLEVDDSDGTRIIQWDTPEEEGNATVSFPLDSIQYLDYLAPVCLDALDDSPQ